MKGAKLVQREMTEEERDAAEAAKGRKGAVAEKPKGKGKGDEEPTEEEVATLKAEIKEREETNLRLKAEWDGLDENTKFFRTCEDPYKNASIRFMNPVDASLEDAGPLNEQAYDLDEAQLREFESNICDNKGCWVYFDKVVPHEEEATEHAAAGGKKAPAKAPPKGKTGQTSAEEAKPTHGRAWLNLTQLLQPGVKQCTSRAFLQQCTPAEAHHPHHKPPTAGEGEMDHVSEVNAIQKTDGTDSVEAPTDLFGDAQAYVHLTIQLSEPLYPFPNNEFIKADGSALTEKYEAPPKFPSTRDAIQEFDDAINFLVQQIGAEYEKANLDAEQPTTSTPSLLKAQGTFMSSKNIEQLADQRREKFLTEFTQSSKYQELRNRLKQAIFRLGMEKIKK